MNCLSSQDMREQARENMNEKEKGAMSFTKCNAQTIQEGED